MYTSQIVKMLDQQYTDICLEIGGRLSRILNFANRKKGFHTSRTPKPLANG
jgi:hypothetical protein